MNWVFMRMPVWAELVYIKQFQIFGYVKKHLTRFVWFDTSMFRSELKYQFDFLANSFAVPSILV